LQLTTKRIEVNPRILAGKPVIKGTRIPVYLVLDLIAGGYDFDKIVEAYPALTPDDVKAAVEYAAAAMKNTETAEYQVA
jgi:uncharacterized protein (DUF433 family)